MNALHEELNEMMMGLFQRHPALCGFSVTEDLSFGNIACHPAVFGEDAQALREEISEALHELLDTRPEAAELLRGRTLARRFH